MKFIKKLNLLQRINLLLGAVLLIHLILWTYFNILPANTDGLVITFMIFFFTIPAWL